MTSSVFLGNLKSYQLDRFYDPDFGEVNEETFFGWQLIHGNNYDYYYLPTYYY